MSRAANPFSASGRAYTIAETKLDKQPDDGAAVGDQIARAAVPDGDREWLAVLIRDGLLVIVAGIERRLGLRRRQACDRCGWRG